MLLPDFNVNFDRPHPFNNRVRLIDLNHKGNHFFIIATRKNVYQCFGYAIAFSNTPILPLFDVPE